MTTQEKRNEKWFDKLVPMGGICETTEGEMLRAINKIFYRFWNDGDYFYEGYGIETAGSAHMYLVEHSQLKEKLAELFQKIHQTFRRTPSLTGKQQYGKILNEATDLILDEIEKLNGNFHPNEIDMLGFPQEQPYYEEEEW
jgi:hypothetical protein